MNETWQYGDSDEDTPEQNMARSRPSALLFLVGLAAMIEQGMVKKLICSFPKSKDPKAFTDRYLAGEIELDDAVFGAPVRRDLLSRMVNYQLAKRRQQERHGGGQHTGDDEGQRAHAGTSCPSRSTVASAAERASRARSAAPARRLARFSVQRPASRNVVTPAATSR